MYKLYIISDNTQIYILYTEFFTQSMSQMPFSFKQKLAFWKSCHSCIVYRHNHIRPWLQTNCQALSICHLVFFRCIWCSQLSTCAGQSVSISIFSDHNFLQNSHPCFFFVARISTRTSTSGHNIVQWTLGVVLPRQWRHKLRAEGSSLLFFGCWVWSYPVYKT